MPVSELCEEYDIQPSVFYGWQRTLVENISAALDAGNGHRRRRQDSEAERLRRENAALKEKLAKKDHVIAEISEEHIALKKELGELCATIRAPQTQVRRHRLPECGRHVLLPVLGSRRVQPLHPASRDSRVDERARRRAGAAAGSGRKRSSPMKNRVSSPTTGRSLWRGTSRCSFARLGPAPSLPHDAVLWRVREPPSPPSSAHPVLAAAARADTALAAHSGSSPRRPPRGCGDPTPARLGQPVGASLRHRRDGLLKVRRSHERPRDRHRSARHRQATARRPRSPATLSSLTVALVRLSPRRCVAVGFARPAAYLTSRSSARAVSWTMNASRWLAERLAHPVERPCADAASASTSLRVPGSSPRLAV